MNIMNTYQSKNFYKYFFTQQVVLCDKNPLMILFAHLLFLANI